MNKSINNNADNNIIINYLSDKGYEIKVNSMASETILLPNSFDEVRDDIKIGEFLEVRNELSKKEGLGFENK